MAVIAKAAEDLAARIARLCPACEAPGFGKTAAIPGLPCQWCGTPTSVPIADEWGCVRCAHRERVPRLGPVGADPGHCPACNP
jgi:hypothetical protein